MGRMVAMRGIHVYTIGQSKGNLRLWMESLSLLDAKMEPGTPVTIEYGTEIVIRKAASEEDARLHVSARRRSGREVPILDLNSGLEPYFTLKEKVRVEIHEGEIHITKQRSFSIMDDHQPAPVHGTQKFSVVEIPSGAGLAGIAFENTGLYEVLAAGDIDEKALEALRYNQPDPVLYWGNMFDIDQSDLPDADVFLFTPDCTSYSRLGRRDYVCSPSAPMVHHGLRFIAAKRFPVVLIENVPPFGESIWYQHYTRIMDDLGYNVEDAVLQAWDFGTIASRPRFISVATQKPYRFEFPKPELNAAHRDKVKKFLRDVEDRKWMSITENKTLRFFFGQHQKEQKDRGNGFGISENVLVGLSDIKMPAVIASYHKIQSSGPFIKHPTDPDKLSMFEPLEILAIQGFPEYEMPPWLSLSTQYQLIGQAICGRMFRSLAVSIATVLMQMKLASQKTRRRIKKSFDGEQLALNFA